MRGVRGSVPISVLVVIFVAIFLAIVVLRPTIDISVSFPPWFP
ncbi:MAG TPA: hypothetical protein VFG07_09015 [Thermoplasmata archaeon]|nr:hypothetical protein [Thermoplasmata archaeon]